MSPAMEKTPTRRATQPNGSLDSGDLERSANAKASLQFVTDESNLSAGKSSFVSYLETVWDEPRRKPFVLIISASTMVTIAAVDWWTKPYVSLGFLYLFPIMLAAGFLPRWSIGLLGGSCAFLAEVFSSLERSLTRLSLETLALAGCGLFVAELVRNRRMTAQSQERSRVLIETSPVAIVTVDDNGFVEMANEAAAQLMAPRDGQILGAPIAAFLPELHFALRSEDAPRFRTSMRCHGRRDNGEAFTADVWFSTYKEGQNQRLAAIIADVTEETMPASTGASTSRDGDSPEFSARESEVIRLVVRGLANKEIAADMGISESVVKNALQQLFAKTGVRSRGQLVRVAMEQHRDLL